MPRQLDETDERLLQLLERNARLTAVALARAVNLSRSAVQERLARLEAEGVIAGYTIRRGSGGREVRAEAILAVRIATRPCENVLRRFSDWPEIVSCWSVASGEVDAYLHVACADGQALGDLRERLANVSGVAEITTAPVLRTVTRRIGP